MIQVLEDRVINKIAAGEVVERPASVVKELVENAIDAGCTRLRVELRAGGRNLVDVSDDGCGMDRQDALLCIERHATSKIVSEADLFSVRTLGFRGEALPSIASVSRFELTTRRSGDEVGTRLSLEGGILANVSDAGCPAGTQISVRSLFFNVPARRKFMRTAQTELSHCVEAVTRAALLRPDLDVELLHDGHTLLRAPRVSDPAARAADLLGPHGEALVPVRFSADGLQVSGLVSPVGVHRAQARGGSYLYVNGRFVKDNLVRRAVAEAYRGIVPKGRYPTVVLDLHVPPDEVDVNVHPAKTEVRFQHAFDLQRALEAGLARALEGHGIKRPVAVEARYRAPGAPASSQQLGLPAPPPPLFRPPEASRPRFVPPELAWEPAPLPGSLPRASQPTPVAPQASEAPLLPVGRPVAEPPVAADESLRHYGRDLLPVPAFAQLRVIGQFARTYILCEGGGELVIVDQHAAHERITLHRLKHDETARLAGAQRLLQPLVVELAPARARTLVAHAVQLQAFGMDIEPFGGTSFAIKQVPAGLKGLDLVQLVADLADDLAGGGRGIQVADRNEYVLATMACRSSIKAGQELSVYEMRQLLGALDGVDYAVCAHGRPVVVSLSLGELERRFHRS